MRKPLLLLLPIVAAASLGCLLKQWESPGATLTSDRWKALLPRGRSGVSICPLLDRLATYAIVPRVPESSPPLGSPPGARPNAGRDDGSACASEPGEEPSERVHVISCYDERITVQLAQVRVEFSNHLAAGIELMNAGNDREACLEFESILEKACWLPNSIHGEPWVAPATRLLAQARASQEAWVRAQAALASARDASEAERQLDIEFAETVRAMRNDDVDAVNAATARILGLDPGNPFVRPIREIADRSRFAKDYFEEDSQASPEVTRLAWLRYAGLEPTFRGNPASRLNPDESLRWRIAGTRVTIDFFQAPLAVVIERLQAASGVPIRLDPDSSNWLAEVRVTLHAMDEALEKVFARLLKLHQVDHRIGGGVVWMEPERPN